MNRLPERRGRSGNGSASDIMWVMDAAEAQELYDIAEAGRAAARTHQPDAEKPVEERYTDVLAALQWHLDHGDVDAGFRFANALVTFWMGTNRIPDGDDWFGRLLATPGGADTTRALALHEHGYLVFWAGEHDRAEELSRQAVDTETAREHDLYLGWTLNGLAAVTAAKGQWVRAATVLGAAASLLQRGGGEWPPTSSSSLRRRKQCSDEPSRRTSSTTPAPKGPRCRAQAVAYALS
jgi:hypothetical protein